MLHNPFQGFVGGAIIYRDKIAVTREMPGHRAAHYAKSEESDVRHDLVSCSITLAVPRNASARKTDGRYALFLGLDFCRDTTKGLVSSSIHDQ